MSASTPIVTGNGGVVFSDGRPVVIATGAVVIGKPWYLSKKVWLAVIGLAVALYTAITGKSETVPEVLGVIAKVASVLGVIVPAILAIAHVDGKERDVAAVALNLATTLGEPDDAPVLAAPPVEPFKVPGLSR